MFGKAQPSANRVERRDIRAKQLKPASALLKDSATASIDLAPQSSHAELAPRTIAIWGAGAVGKTTVAVNLAAALSHRNTRVLVVDADLVSPSAAIHLGLGNDATGIASICRAAREARLDRSELLRLAIRIQGLGTDFSVIPGISATLRWPEITPSSIEVLVRIAAEDFDVVIFDLASSIEPALKSDASAIARNELTRYLLSNSDDAILLCGADPVGIHRFLRNFLDVQRFRGSRPVHIVVNRLRERAVGANPRRQIERVMDQLLKVKPTHYLPDDPLRVDDALREGIPVRSIARRGIFAKALAEFATMLVE